MLALMRRRMGIGLAWLGATVLSVLIASAAVAGIRDRVVETPVAIGLPSTTTTTLPTETVTSSSAVPTTTLAPSTTSTTTSTTAAPPVTTTTIVGSSVTTTASPPETTTTIATTPPPTTTTAAVVNETYDLVGGTVTLSIGNGEVNLVSAVPRPGFSTDFEHTGPSEVEIKFESNDHKSKLEAQWENDELKISVEEEPHDDD